MFFQAHFIVFLHKTSQKWINSAIVDMNGKIKALVAF